MRSDAGKATAKFGDRPVSQLNALDISGWRAKLPETIIYPAHDEEAHEHAHHAEDQEEVTDVLFGNPETLVQIQGEDGRCRVICQHRDRVDDDRQCQGAQRVPEHFP